MSGNVTTFDDFLNAFVVVNPANILSNYLHCTIFQNILAHCDIPRRMGNEGGQSHNTTRQDDEHETCVIVTQWAFQPAETHIFLLR